MGRDETVVLLHGLGRTRASLLVLQMALNKRGYRTLSFSYRAASTSMDDIVRALHDYLRQAVSTPRYHLVGHSLGNIIIRQGFTAGYSAGLGRIVMIAPPNQPAHLAIKLRDNPLFRRLAGDAGQKLGDEAFYRALPIPSVEFGIIAGSKGQNLTFDEANDGIVSLESTKLASMTDWVEVSNLHTFIMNSRATREHVASFIETGRFHRAP